MASIACCWLKILLAPMGNAAPLLALCALIILSKFGSFNLVNLLLLEHVRKILDICNYV